MKHVPNEIVDRILKNLYRDCCEGKGKKPTCTYASVCPLWQEYFEEKHFEKLSLTWQDLPELKDYVVGERRRLVKRISVRIPFGRSERWKPKAEMYQYIITTIFEILGTWWDIFNSKNPGKMMLQIGVLHCNNLSLADLPPQFKLSYKPPLSLSRTPPVYAVRSLVLHRSVYEVFQAIPKALHYLLRSLPTLGQVTSENEDLNTEPSKVYEQIFRSLPASVSELKLFEESRPGSPFCPFFPLQGHSMFRYRMPPGRLILLALDLARVSRQLRHLAASFVVDAKDFFQPFWPRPPTARPINTDEWVWDELETLALTSKLLRRPNKNQKEVNRLLEAVSVAVRRMPKLRTLEIWNGDDEQHGCIFRYSYSPASRRVSLGLKGTRKINISQDTRRSWGETVRQKVIMENDIDFWFEKLNIGTPCQAEAVAWFLESPDRVATEGVTATAGFEYYALPQGLWAS